MSSQAKTYLVSFLHALPFIFQVEFPQSLDKQNGTLQPPVLQELGETYQKLGMMDLHQESKVPMPLNLMYPCYDCGAVFAALDLLPISTPFINIAVTLISAMYPSHYGWNLPNLSITSPTILTGQIPVSELHSTADLYWYTQLDDGIAIQGLNSQYIYHDKSHIPPCVQGFQYDLFTYPYGWSAGIESFCLLGDYHPCCTDPHSHACIERDFIAFTIGEPSLFSILDEHLNIVYSNATGKNFQWLWSSSGLIKDHPRQRAVLVNLYSQIDHQQGQVFHSKNGLWIVIPDEKWINWRTFSPTAQTEFMRVAWAQITQFDKTTFMTCLGKDTPDDASTFDDDDDDTAYGQFWTTELDVTRWFYIELISHIGAFHYYNPYVIQELMYYNEPHDSPLLSDWMNAKCPSSIFLLYSGLTIEWDTTHHIWAYTDIDQKGPSPNNAANHNHYDSYFDMPINTSERDDQEMD
jgi:hypothetical protein